MPKWNPCDRRNPTMNGMASDSRYREAAVCYLRTSYFVSLVPVGGGTVALHSFLYLPCPALPYLARWITPLLPRVSLFALCSTLLLTPTQSLLRRLAHGTSVAHRPPPVCDFFFFFFTIDSARTHARTQPSIHHPPSIHPYPALITYILPTARAEGSLHHRTRRTHTNSATLAALAANKSHALLAS